jgi:hypothetical protein
MSDYRVKIHIRNNRLLSRMEECGYRSVNKFCKLNMFSYGAVSNLFSGKLKPINEKGNLISVAEKVLERLDMNMEEAFTKRQLEGFVQTTFEKNFKEIELKQIISPVKNQDLLIMEKETHKVLEKMINQLNLREQDIVKQINGFGSSSKVTLQSLGDKYSISRTRVGEIYRIALRKLSHWKNINKLKHTGAESLL